MEEKEEQEEDNDEEQENEEDPKPKALKSQRCLKENYYSLDDNSSREEGENETAKNCTASTYTTCLTALFSEQKKDYSWKSGPVVITVAMSLSNDESKNINLTSTIGHGKYCPKPGKQMDANCHWLPIDLDKNNETFRTEEPTPGSSRHASRLGFRSLIDM